MSRLSSAKVPPKVSDELLIQLSQRKRSIVEWSRRFVARRLNVRNVVIFSPFESATSDRNV
jgi:predicted aldo/keto reductase-like oxidoreductase